MRESDRWALNPHPTLIPPIESGWVEGFIASVVNWGWRSISRRVRMFSLPAVTVACVPIDVQLETAHAKVHETIEEASQVLGQDVLELDTERALSSTVAVQLALLISAAATTRALQAEGVEPEVVAGLSVGAFAAAVAADSLAFKDALPLVKLRAELMEKAYPNGY